jgi:hypothetical protein
MAIAQQYLVAVLRRKSGRRRRVLTELAEVSGTGATAFLLPVPPSSWSRRRRRWSRRRSVA